MNCLASHSRRAWPRSQSITWRWTSGNGTRRRSGRGGKRSAGTTTPTFELPLLPLAPNQIAVGQHHRHGMPVEPRPQPTLVLIPAQLPLGLFVVLLHPVSPVGVLHHRGQRHRRPEVAPVVLAAGLLTRHLPLADQPTEVTPAVRGNPPASLRHESAPQPPRAALSPADRAPRRLRQRLQQGFGPPTRFGPPTVADHREVATDGDHVA